MTDATNLIRIVQETQPDEIYNLAAQIACPGLVRDAGIHRQRRRASARCACSRRSACSKLVDKTRFYQASTSELFGKVAGGPADRKNALLSALALCRRQALRLLDHRQLSRGLWHPRLQRHPVQPRKPAARRNLRHPQDHPRRRRHPPRHAGQALSRQSRRQARLGPCARICPGHVADAPAAGSRRLRAGDRRNAQQCAASSKGRSRTSASGWNGRAQGVEEKGHRRRDRASAGRGRSPLFPPDRSRSARSATPARRAKARLAARDQPRTLSRNGREDLQDHGQTRDRDAERVRAMSEVVYPLAGKRVWVAGHAAWSDRRSCAGSPAKTAKW